MKRPVKKVKPVISVRLAFLFGFTLFYWVFHFYFQKTNLQVSQVVFNLSAGLFSGAVVHVAIAKFFGPLLFGRGFCSWACWNASLFEVLPVRGQRKTAKDRYHVKYYVLVLALALPLMFLALGYSFTSREAQFKWLLAENAAIYVIGTGLAFKLGDQRAFCKYLCPAGALMTVTSPHSLLKVEKNHLKCSKCRICEQVCPMDIPVMTYISSGQRVSHPECTLCVECVNKCPKNCLIVGVGQKSDTTPQLGKSY